MAHARSRDLNSSDQGTLSTVKQANTDKTLEKRIEQLITMRKRNGLSIGITLNFNCLIQLTMHDRYIIVSSSRIHTTTEYKSKLGTIACEKLGREKPLI